MEDKIAPFDWSLFGGQQNIEWVKSQYNFKDAIEQDPIVDHYMSGQAYRDWVEKKKAQDSNFIFQENDIVKVVRKSAQVNKQLHDLKKR